MIFHLSKYFKNAFKTFFNQNSECRSQCVQIHFHTNQTKDSLSGSNEALDRIGPVLLCGPGSAGQVCANLDYR